MISDIFEFFSKWVDVYMVFYSVMCVQFIPKTHLFFSGGKDKKIKEWDADRFEHIQTLEVS